VLAGEAYRPTPRWLVGSLRSRVGLTASVHASSPNSAGLSRPTGWVGPGSQRLLGRWQSDAGSDAVRWCCLLHRLPTGWVGRGVGRRRAVLLASPPPSGWVRRGVGRCQVVLLASPSSDRVGRTRGRTPSGGAACFTASVRVGQTRGRTLSGGAARFTVSVARSTVSARVGRTRGRTLSGGAVCFTVSVRVGFASPSPSDWKWNWEAGSASPPQTLGATPRQPKSPQAQQH
jgi:hypothetical protein